MANAYNFTPEQWEKIELYFYPIFGVYNSTLDEVAEDLETIGIESKFLLELFQKTEKFEYVEDVFELSDIYEDLFDDISVKILKVQLDEEKTRPYFLFSNLYELASTLYIMREYIKENDANVRINGVPLGLEDIESLIKTRVDDVLEEVFNVLSESDDKKAKVLVKELNSVMDIQDDEKFTDGLINFTDTAIEFYSAKDMDEESRKIDDEFKAVHKFLSTATSLMNIVIYLKEIDWEEELRVQNEEE